MSKGEQILVFVPVCSEQQNNVFKYEFLQRLLRIANVAKRVVLQGFIQESKCVQGCIFVEICSGY